MNDGLRSRNNDYRDYTNPSRQRRSYPEKRRKKISATQILHWIITIALVVVVGIEGLYIHDLRQRVINPSDVGSATSQISGSNIDGSNYVGEYYCNEWNGKPATLSLKADGSGVYPTGEPMTWEYKNGSLYFYISGDATDEHIAIPSTSGISLHNTPFFRY